MIKKNGLNKTMLFICCISLMLFSGCGKSKTPLAQTVIKEEQIYKAEAEQQTTYQYSTNTEPVDCCLCGDGKGTLLPYYRGQDNVGIISLNTFNLSIVEINRYDDSGKLIKEPAPSSSIHIRSDDGCTLSVSENPDRGYADCDLFFKNDTVLNLEAAATFLCSDCLNNILDECWGTPYGIGIINFKTMEIRLLEKM